MSARACSMASATREPVVFPVGSRAVMCEIPVEPSDDLTRELMSRLEDFLEAGRTTVFVDLAKLTDEPSGLRLALARWGMEHRDRLLSMHVRVPTAASHYRMSVTGLVLGRWLVSHFDPQGFHEELSHFYVDAEEGAVAPC